MHVRAKQQYSTVQYSTVQYSTVQYSTVQYMAAQYSIVLYSAVQCSTVQCSALYDRHHRKYSSTNQYRGADLNKFNYSRSFLLHTFLLSHF